MSACVTKKEYTVAIIRQDLENTHQTEQWLCLAWRGKVQGEKRLENKSGKEKLLNVHGVEKVKQLLEKWPGMDRTSEKIMKPNNSFETHCKVLK